jgi:hypothetical protein
MLEIIVEKLNRIVNIEELSNSRELVLGMLLSEPNKNCITMAKPLNISHDVIQNIFKAAPKSILELKSFLLSLIKLTSKKSDKSYLIIDDSTLQKDYASILEGLSLVHDSLSNSTVKGYKIVALCWTNGKITIPISFEFWLPKDFLKENYKTKLELEQKLILECKDLIKFQGVLLDGLYASEDMMSFFEKNIIFFYMRLPRSRKVRLTLDSIGFKIGDSRYFKLKKNNRYALFEAYFGEKKRYIYAEKRNNRSFNKEIVYVISNEKVEPHAGVTTYSKRWAIEKFFRTAKQTLGIASCMARTLDRQKLHILGTFASYAILELIKIQKKLTCPEEASRYLQQLKTKKFRMGNQI